MKDFLPELPIVSVIPQLRKELDKHHMVVLSAPPGAGKSTLLPLALLQERWLNGKKIMLLEPRRLAASSIAQRMASLLNEAVGETVGYRIRFDQRIGANTKIEVVTEGVLIRLLQEDNALENVGLVMFDEFHERHIHSDVSLALCRECQQVLRPDLRLLVMSATLDKEELPAQLNAAFVESKGRIYPVEVFYGEDIDEYQLVTAISSAIVKSVREDEGDLLVFLPGQSEIERCRLLLKKELKHIAVYPLYGLLPFEEQQAAILPHPNGLRKIVLATAIAETSLTIEGIKVVIDCGFTRQSVFDARTGLPALKTVRISKDVAEQRAGRAGRLSAGKCYRMWSIATDFRLEAFRRPEMLYADLAPLALELAKWGVRDPAALTWITLPPETTFNQSKMGLRELSILDGDKLTKHGEYVHKLACHPRIAHMLIRSVERQLVPLACDLAAILESRDMLSGQGIDISLRIAGLRHYRQHRGSMVAWKQVERLAANYHRMMGAIPSKSTIMDDAVGLLLAFAFPERIAKAKPGYEGQFALANGRMAFCEQQDTLAHEPWLAIAQLDGRSGSAKIYLAASLNPEDLQFLTPVKKRHIYWDNREGKIRAVEECLIGGLVWKANPIVPDQEASSSVLRDVMKGEGAQLLDFNEQVQQWQNRVLSLRRWNPEQAWPDVSTDALLLEVDKWLLPYLGAANTAANFRKINLMNLLPNLLPYDNQRKLDRLAPTHISVPSGSRIKLQYHATGDVPILSVRLQEVFGLLDTPLINEGKQAVLLHLLSPGFKPVQVTTDLKSFWENTYFEVKKELKRRYPKHAWPDDPLQEQALRGPRKKRSML